MAEDTTKKTTDHDAIKHWAEERGGHPAMVKGTESNGEGLLRIDFEGNGERKDHSLDPVSWNEFFKTFDDRHLSFLYQDKTDDGQTSRFFKFVNS